MTRLRFGGVLTALILAAGASFAGEPETKAPTLEGRWKFVSWEDLGEKAPAASIKNFRWTFRGDEAVWSPGEVPGRKAPREAKYKFEKDPSRSPKWITLTPVGAKRGTPTLGIYEFEEGRLKLCMPSDPVDGEAGRPSSFEAGRGSGQMLMVLERDEE